VSYGEFPYDKISIHLDSRLLTTRRSLFILHFACEEILSAPKFALQIIDVIVYCIDVIVYCTVIFSRYSMAWNGLTNVAYLFEDLNDYFI